MYERDHIGKRKLNFGRYLWLGLIGLTAGRLNLKAACNIGLSARAVSRSGACGRCLVGSLLGRYRSRANTARRGQRRFWRRCRAGKTWIRHKIRTRFVRHKIRLPSAGCPHGRDTSIQMNGLCLVDVVRRRFV